LQGESHHERVTLLLRIPFAGNAKCPKCLLIGLEKHASTLHSFLNSHDTGFDSSSFQPTINLPVLEEHDVLSELDDETLTDAIFWSRLRLMSTKFENKSKQLKVCPTVTQSTIFDRPVKRSPMSRRRQARPRQSYQWSPLKSDEQKEFARTSAISKQDYKTEEAATKSTNSEQQSNRNQVKQKSQQADWSW
jgi:hypothetical protein